MKKSELRQMIKEELQKSSPKKLLTEGTPGIEFAKNWAEKQKIKKEAKQIKEVKVKLKEDTYEIKPHLDKYTVEHDINPKLHDTGTGESKMYRDGTLLAHWIWGEDGVTKKVIKSDVKGLVDGLDELISRLGKKK